MKQKLFSLLLSAILAGCVVPGRARYGRGNRVEFYRIKQQADAMQQVAAGVVFTPNFPHP